MANTVLPTANCWIIIRHFNSFQLADRYEWKRMKMKTFVSVEFESSKCVCFCTKHTAARAQWHSVCRFMDPCTRKHNKIVKSAIVMPSIEAKKRQKPTKRNSRGAGWHLAGIFSIQFPSARSHMHKYLFYIYRYCYHLPSFCRQLQLMRHNDTCGRHQYIVLWLPPLWLARTIISAPM